jgi:hypothetical protein
MKGKGKKGTKGYSENESGANLAGKGGKKSAFGKKKLKGKTP